ncbi:MAG: hypothetical protein PHX09_01685 [Clostridia bacterium]|nr:hypothetical protein [Clostridia bacterium]
MFSKLKFGKENLKENQKVVQRFIKSYNLLPLIYENVEFKKLANNFLQFIDFGDIKMFFGKNAKLADKYGKVRTANGVYGFLIDEDIKTPDEDYQQGGLEVVNSVLFKLTQKPTEQNRFESIKMAVCTGDKNSVAYNVSNQKDSNKSEYTILVVDKKDYEGNRVISYYDDKNNWLMADIIEAPEKTKVNESKNELNSCR